MKKSEENVKYNIKEKENDLELRINKVINTFLRENSKNNIFVEFIDISFIDVYESFTDGTPVYLGKELKVKLEKWKSIEQREKENLINQK